MEFQGFLPEFDGSSTLEAVRWASKPVLSSWLVVEPTPIEKYYIVKLDHFHK